MNKIKKAFLNYVVKFDKGNIEEDSNYRFEDFEAGYKSANLLPTEKICPECGGSGFDNNEDFTDDISKCSNCKNGKIQIYYTPEEYKEITGEDFPDMGMVWCRYKMRNRDHTNSMFILPYPVAWKSTKDIEDRICYIVQTAQKCPGADYRREG